MDANIVTLVQLFNTQTEAIKLGLQEIGFSISNVKYIFGIVDGNKKIVVSKGGRKKSVVLDRLFPTNDKLDQKLLKQRLEELVGNSDQVDKEDTVRILCLVLILSLFFCSSGLRTPRGWVDFVENLDNMKSYDLFSKILTTLIDSMTVKKSLPSKINGCTLFLLVLTGEPAAMLKEMLTFKKLEAFLSHINSSTPGDDNFKYPGGVEQQAIFGYEKIVQSSHEKFVKELKNENQHLKDEICRLNNMKESMESELQKINGKSESLENKVTLLTKEMYMGSTNIKPA